MGCRHRLGDRGSDVNTEQPIIEDEIWAYLHGELDPAAVRDVERRLAADGAWRHRVEQARRLDRLLRLALPAVAAGGGASDETLAEAILAAWEQETQAAGGVTAAATGVARPRLRFSRTYRAGLAALAAALLALALLPVFRRPPALPPAGWAPVAFAPLSYRGAAGAPAAGRLDRSDALRMQAALADALSWALADRGGRLPDGLTLSLGVNELPAGAFAVVVRAEGADGRLRREWSGDYSCRERFFEQADASAAQIAGDLAVPVAAGGLPRRPAEP